MEYRHLQRAQTPPQRTPLVRFWWRATGMFTNAPCPWRTRRVEHVHVNDGGQAVIGKCKDGWVGRGRIARAERQRSGSSGGPGSLTATMPIKDQPNRTPGYDVEIAETICERLVNGESLRAICADPAMPARATVFRWLARNHHPTCSRDGYTGPSNIGAVAWQNGYSERLIGSIRRECLDHVVVFGEQHLRYLLNLYREYYNEARTHLAIFKDAPIPRAIQAHGRICAIPILGGLHHQYCRV
jgi:hypothetical protein